MERIEMSQGERDKLEWLKRAKDGVITQREAANKMGVSDRWVRNLLKRMKKRSAAPDTAPALALPPNRARRFSSRAIVVVGTSLNTNCPPYSNNLTAFMRALLDFVHLAARGGAPNREAS